MRRGRREARSPASYALGLGANRGRATAMLGRAIAALAEAGLHVRAVSPILSTAPMGPGRRRYANAAMIVETGLPPPALLSLVKQIERRLGRRPGRRWGDRVIDIDLLLWSGGRWRERRLQIPHVGLTSRRFVIDPLMAIAPGWRLSDGRTIRHASAQLTRPRAAHRAPRL